MLKTEAKKVFATLTNDKKSVKRFRKNEIYSYERENIWGEIVIIDNEAIFSVFQDKEDREHTLSIASFLNGKNLIFETGNNTFSQYQSGGKKRNEILGGFAQAEEAMVSPEKIRERMKELEEFCEQKKEKLEEQQRSGITRLFRKREKRMSEEELRALLETIVLHLTKIKKMEERKSICQNIDGKDMQRMSETQEELEWVSKTEQKELDK